MYKNYFFDLYGTLVDIKTNEDSEFVWEKMSLYFSYFGAYYEAQELQDDYKKIIAEMLSSNKGTSYPEIDVEYVFYQLFKNKDIKLRKRMARDAAKVFRLFTTNSLEIFEGVLGFLTILNAQKKKIFILANAQNTYTNSETRRVGIKKFIDGFFLSSDYGKCLPDFTFIETVFDTADLKKKESILISADYDNYVKSAMAAGVDVLFINSNPEEMQENVDCLYEVKGRDYQEIANLLIK